MVSLLVVLLIALPWLGAACAALANGRDPRRLHVLAAGFALATGCVAVAALFLARSAAAVRLPLGGVFGDFILVPDGLGLLIAAVASIVGSLAVIFAVNYMHADEQLSRFYAFMLFFIGAMNGLGLSGSLLFTFVFWEITALCSYALISFHNDDLKAVAGGVKALVMTQLGGVGLLAGALLLYSHQGNYEISAFLANPQVLPAGVLALLAFGLLAGSAAKSAQVPFHSWLPDAMEAPTPVTALIHAATMVNAGVYLLARFYPAFAAVPGWRLTVMIVGAASALVGGLQAACALDLKRALAFSTISQLGFMVYAVGAGGIFPAALHLLSHALFKALLFLSSGAIITALGTRDLRQMGGLGRKMPFVRAAFVIGALGLAGLPIANGFFSKDLVLESGLAGGPAWLYALMLFAVALTACYSLRLVWLVFYGQRRGPEPAHDGLPAMRFSLAALAFATLTSWLLAGPLSSLLASTLPAQALVSRSTGSLVLDLLASPWTWLTLAVVALGFGVYLLRGWLAAPLRWLRPVVEGGFGFPWLERQVIGATRWISERLQRLQTGQLNWNAFGLLAGLLAVLAVLAGAAR